MPSLFSNFKSWSNSVAVSALVCHMFEDSHDFRKLHDVYVLRTYGVLCTTAVTCLVRRNSLARTASSTVFVRMEVCVIQATELVRARVDLSARGTVYIAHVISWPVAKGNYLYGKAG